jgi:hypothetical protein
MSAMSDPKPTPSPVPPPHFSSGYFRDVAAAGSRPPLGRGLVGHVPIVAGLMVGLGVLEVSLALLFVLFGLVSLAIPRDTGANPEMLAVLYGGMAMLTASCGSIRIAAGLYNLRFRRRKLGIVALGMGLAAAFTGMCAPTSIGLAVYGLIVLLNEPVIAAFDLGNEGKTPAEIQAAFPPGR